MKKDSDGNSPAKKSSTAKRFNDVQFINAALTVNQKAELKAWTPSLEEFDDITAELIEESNKVTVSYDAFASCYSCSIVPQPKHKVNYGYILVGKGSTPLKAWKQAVYIHKTVFDGDWSAYSTGERREDLDD